MERVRNESPLPLEGRVAMVTGAARGIGRAIAEGLAEAGAVLEISDVDEASAAVAADGLRADRRTAAADAVSTGVDVADADAVGRWVADVVRRRGRIDVLVNNAGIQLNRAAVDLSDEDWRLVLGIDLDGAFWCSREAGRHMCAQGSGAIVNIASIADRFGMPRRLPYGVSKAGLSALTRGLAAEWAPHGVRVNAVAPGYVETELVRHALEMGHIDREAILAKIPLGRFAEPRSIADAVVFLASDRADYLTGQTLYVDGGYAIYK